MRWMFWFQQQHKAQKRQLGIGGAITQLRLYLQINTFKLEVIRGIAVSLTANATQSKEGNNKFQVIYSPICFPPHSISLWLVS